MVDRPKTELELLGERLLRVVRDHAADSEPTIKLITDAAWALGLEATVYTVPRAVGAIDPDFAEVEPAAPTAEGAVRLREYLGLDPAVGYVVIMTGRYVVRIYDHWTGSRPPVWEGSPVVWTRSDPEREIVVDVD